MSHESKGLRYRSSHQPRIRIHPSLRIHPLHNHHCNHFHPLPNLHKLSKKRQKKKTISKQSRLCSSGCMLISFTVSDSINMTVGDWSIIEHLQVETCFRWKFAFCHQYYDDAENDMQNCKYTTHDSWLAIINTQVLSRTVWCVYIRSRLFGFQMNANKQEKSCAHTDLSVRYFSNKRW